MPNFIEIEVSFCGLTNVRTLCMHIRTYGHLRVALLCRLRQGIYPKTGEIWSTLLTSGIRLIIDFTSHRHKIGNFKRRSSGQSLGLVVKTKSNTTEVITHE